MRTVASYTTAVEAEVVWSRLESAGVEAVIRDELSMASLWLESIALGGVRIDVIEEDYDAAREIVSIGPSHDGVIRCPHCSGGDCHVRTLSLFGAVCIYLRLPIPMKWAVADCRECKRHHKVRIDGTGAG